MRFTLEVQLAEETPDDVVLDELGRILRYWAGNLKHYPLTDGQSEVLRDSSYEAVGTWRIERPATPAEA